MIRRSIRLRTGTGTVDLFVGETRIIHHSDRHPLCAVGLGSPDVTSSHGNFRIRGRLRWKEELSNLQVEESDEHHAILLASGKRGSRLRISVVMDDADGRLVRVNVAPDSGCEHNRLWLRLPAAIGEPTYGAGTQFSRFNLRGSRVPIWTGEQGVGRAFNLTTLLANLHSGSGGHWHSTYFPQPTYVTGQGRFVHAQTGCYAELGFHRGVDELELWTPACDLVLGAADSLGDAVSALSACLGRQPRLPDWVHDGMWLGLQGGSDIVRSKAAKARDAGIPLSGVWVQDWVGKRETAFGRQLFWDWKYDAKTYPDLKQLTGELRESGIRFLGYINPFLAIEGELYKEASAAGFCVKNRAGEDYMITVTTFPAALVDLSNPDAWSWYKHIIRENMLGVGLSGWMADYGEYLPADAVLANADPMEYHNRYPAEWARLNHEALVEAGRIDDTVVFMRAGYTGSSRYTHATWAGDQMVDWSRHDGLPSVIPAALSCGMVGIGVTHSDVGGFTSLFFRRRSKELFMRWAEHSAFTPIMRTHESNRPADNWQWDGDRETMTHLARMARIYAALAPYRREVLNEYYATGLPAMRPEVIHYTGYAPATRRRASSYLFGRDLFAQPVVRPGARTAKVLLPDDEWVHLWTGRSYGGGSVRVDAPPGCPPVFYRAESLHAATFQAVAGQ